MTMWQGRFGSTGPSDDLLRFTGNLHVDRRLAGDDIEGSRAHVRGLGRAGVLDAGEVAGLLGALDAVEDELRTGRLALSPNDEDVHTLVERRVTELVGELGGRLHTGRSRNDQVVTDLRLFTRRELVLVCRGVLELQTTLFDRSLEVGDVYLPGYTHLQRAQPVTLAHHLLAHAWALGRDVERLLDALVRVDVSPLGAGALAGSSLPLDPDGVAADLGFARRFENSLDAVSDRDFVAESLFVLALLGVHLSRMGEEIVLWSTSEFGFVQLHDAYSTGSSMLPQKKNPDIAELARGKSGRLIGNLTGLLAMLRGLPLAYNRDLQEDKEPLFDSIDQVRRALSAMSGLYRTSRFDFDAMRSAADIPEAAAVDLAEYLVGKGIPFRDAHGIVGGLVRDAHERGVPFIELVDAHPELGSAGVEMLRAGAPVRRRTTPGAAGPDAVAVQRERLSSHMSDLQSRIDGWAKVVGIVDDE